MSEQLVLWLRKLRGEFQQMQEKIKVLSDYQRFNRIYNGYGTNQRTTVGYARSGIPCQQEHSNRPYLYVVVLYMYRM